MHARDGLEPCAARGDKQAVSSEDTFPQATIIIVTFNSEKHFARLRAALYSQNAPYRLIVFDNGSAPERRPTADAFPAGATIMQSEDNIGFAAANNRAAEGVETPWLALLNPDAYPEPDWLAQLLHAGARFKEAGAFSSTQIMESDPARYDGLGDCYAPHGGNWRGGHRWARSGYSSSEGEVFSACAAAALYRTTAWREARGFDERYFGYCEDLDLGFRLRLLGRKTIHVPDAVVRHVGGGSSARGSDFECFHTTRNCVWTFVKDMPGWLFWLLAPAFTGFSIVRLLSASVRGNGGPTWRGLRAAIHGLPETWRARSEIQMHRKAKASEIAAALTWSPFKLWRRAPDIRPIRDQSASAKASARKAQ